MKKTNKMLQIGFLLGLTGILLSGCLTWRVSSNKEVEEIRDQVRDLGLRLQTVEAQPEKIKGVIKQARAAVVYLWGTYTFVDSEGRPLRYILGSDGKPVADPQGTPRVDMTGTGPVAISNYCGTAFLVDNRGGLITNRHVAEPWWEDEPAEPLLAAGLRPVFLRLRAFFMEKTEGIPIEVLRIHPDQDLAYLRTVDFIPRGKPLPLYPETDLIEDGQPVILIGFPTGLEAVLAKLSDAEVLEVDSADGPCTYETAERLAQRQKISPTITGGFLWEALPHSLVYDARTKSGGSGGPLLNYQGQVLGVNVASLPEFSGGNYGVPVRFVAELLQGKGLPASAASRERGELSGWLDRGQVPIASCSE